MSGESVKQPNRKVCWHRRHAKTGEELIPYQIRTTIDRDCLRLAMNILVIQAESAFSFFIWYEMIMEMPFVSMINWVRRRDLRLDFE